MRYKRLVHLLLLDESDLDVAGAGHVGVDPPVGPVCPPPHLGGTVHLHMVSTFGQDAHLARTVGTVNKRARASDKGNKIETRSRKLE